MGEARRCPGCGGWILSHERHCAVCGPPEGAAAGASDPFASASLDLPPPPPPPPPAAAATGQRAGAGSERPPDLDSLLPAPPAQGRVAKATAAPAPSAGAAGEVDDPLEPPIEGDLELALDERALTSRKVAAPTPAPAPTPAAAASVEAAPAPTPTSSISEGRAAAAEPPLPRHEVLAVAGYGEAPDGWLAAIFYTLGVAQRWPALRQELQEARLAAEAAERTATEALAALGRAIHERREALPPEPREALSALLAAVTREEAAVQAARQGEAEQAGPLLERARALQAEIAAAEEAATPARNEEARVATRAQIAEGELRSLEGRRKRVEIELRNARSMQPPDPARIAQLEAELRARQAEEEVVRRKVEGIRGELATARERLGERLEAVRVLQEELARLQAAARSASQESAAVLEAAEARLRAALAALGEAALPLELGELGGEALGRAAAAHRSHLARRRRLRLVEAALDAWDRRAVYRGGGLLGGAALLLLVTLLVAIFR